jgi:hypothetical protein
MLDSTPAEIVSESWYSFDLMLSWPRSSLGRFTCCDKRACTGTVCVMVNQNGHVRATPLWRYNRLRCSTPHMPKSFLSLGTASSRCCLGIGQASGRFNVATNEHARVPRAESRPEWPCLCKASLPARYRAILDPMAAGTGSECFRSWQSSASKHWPSLGKV